MTQTATTQEGLAAFRAMSKEFGALLDRVDQFCDWHIPIQDLNMDDRCLDITFFDLKNPTTADRSLYAFLKGIPEWARHAVLDCYEQEFECK